MKIGPKMLTLAAMTALSVGAVFAQGTAPKPAKASNPPMASKMADQQTSPSQPSNKKASKHGHHHNKSKKHASSTPSQDTATKK